MDALVKPLDESAEHSPLLQSSHEESDLDLEFGTESRKALERQLLRKVDIRMSILVLIYILNYIDRNNASAARLKGFERDLNLEGSQFATVLSILYVGYVIMQIPSNIFLSRFGRPSIYLGICMIIWGFISVATVPHFQMVQENELSQRTALLSCGSLISNAIGSLVASVILDVMDNRLGFAAWRWLFFCEGGLTVIVAILAIFILPDFPETSSGWLTPAEQRLAIKRMTEDMGDKPEAEHKSGLLLAVVDWKVWWLAATLTTIVAGLSWNAYFPSILLRLGFSSTNTLLLCVPPWIFSALVAIALSRHSDHTGERFWHMTGSLGVGVLGFFLAMSTMNVAVSYVSLFLIAQSYAGFICFLAWASGSISYPAEKKAVGLALINSVSTSGNIVGSYFWPTSWGPSYRVSFSICTFATVLGVIMSWVFRRELQRMNRLNASNGERYRYML
ncbi:major facilitator superfamily domain-containing protein [Mycena floridula]|nr:major facilitator superfamily domain-containing protein [Mycena floridula]